MWPCRVTSQMTYKRRFRTSRETDMQRIGFIVFPGYQVMSFAVISVFEFANLNAGEPIYDVRLLSEAGGLVLTSIGIRVETAPFDDSDLDTLIVGGGTQIEPSTPGLLAFVAQGLERYRR